MKQRLVGAAVLVALAVIFLPMLVQGPAPDSGVSDVPLTMPDAPPADYETRDLPLMGPGATPEGGALGMEAGHNGPDQIAADAPVTSVPLPADPASPTSNPDAAELAQPAAPEPTAPPEPRLPATTAAGDYAVSFGSFTTADAADKVIASLRSETLPGYRESGSVDGKAVQRVRIGPYATRADAEIARQRAARVRSDVNARVVVLDAEPAPPKTVSQPTPPQPPVAPASLPAAADTGFAVQIGAFSKPADATALRDKVRASGLNAFTEAVQTDKGVLTRVKVGPVATRAEVNQLKGQVKAKLGIDGIVRAHP